MLSFYEILINIIIVSIPEVIFLAYIILIIMERYDYVDKYNFKESFKKIMLIVVIPYALLSSFTLHVLDLSLYIRVGINIGLISLLVTILLWSKSIFKIIIASMIGLAIIIFVELLTGLIINYGFNINGSALNVSPWSNFVLTLPVRVIQFGLIYMLYLKKNAIVSINLYSIWRENPSFRKLLFVCTLINIVIGLFMYNKFTLNAYLEVLPIDVQLFIVIALFILIIINTIIPWVTIISIYPGEKYKKSYKEWEI